MATIKDIAKAAGCSISTVSYALNNDHRISEKTALRIKKIAKDLNYFPSAAARNLKRQNTRTILVAISDFGGPVYHALLDGLHHELAKNDYTMIVSTGASTDKMLKQRSADGAIISDINVKDDFLKKVSLNFNPIIVLDRSLKEDTIYNLTIDNESAMYQLTEDIIKSSYKKIAFVHGVQDAYDNQTRYIGFKQAMKNYSQEIFSEYNGNFTKESGETVAKSIMKSDKLPDMLVCSNDEMALGIVETLTANGYKIPQDIGVSGFDDIMLSSYIKPKLTSIRINHFDWGKRVAKTMVKLLNNENIKIEKEQGNIIKRDSY